MNFFSYYGILILIKPSNGLLIYSATHYIFITAYLLTLAAFEHFHCIIIRELLFFCYSILTYWPQILDHLFAPEISDIMASLSCVAYGLSIILLICSLWLSISFLWPLKNYYLRGAQFIESFINWSIIFRPLNSSIFFSKNNYLKVFPHI